MSAVEAPQVQNLNHGKEQKVARKTFLIETMLFRLTIKDDWAGRPCVTLNDDDVNGVFVACSSRDVANATLDFMSRIAFQRVEVDGIDHFTARIPGTDVSMYAKTAGGMLLLAGQFAHGVASASVLNIDGVS